MELRELEDKIVKYYDIHKSKYVQSVVMAYVKSHYDKKNYDSLLQSIIRSHPFNFGFPDVCAIEDAQDKLYIRDKKSLRKSQTSSDWKIPIKPLTEEERKEAEPMWKDWKKFVGKISYKAKDKLSCSTCTYLKPTKTGICEKCIDFSKHETGEK